jgi:hypothetical protein
MNRLAGVIAVLPWVAAGCASTSTFVSVEPPPGAVVEASFTSGAPEVVDALLKAMSKAGLTVDVRGEGGDRVVGVRQQVPFVGKGTTAPAAGALPVYRLTAAVTSRGQTLVTASVEVLCKSCDGETPYEWEYPTDLLRTVIEGACHLLGERGHRVTYPPRHRPAEWRPDGRLEGTRSPAVRAWGRAASCRIPSSAHARGPGGSAPCVKRTGFTRPRQRPSEGPFRGLSIQGRNRG